jgi:hypothetical protein
VRIAGATQAAAAAARQQRDRGDGLAILPPGLAAWVAQHRHDGHDSDG